MTNREMVQTLLENSADGIITAEQVTAAGLHRSILQKLVDSGELYQFSRGIYVRADAWEDDFYLLQRRYGRGIYSHDTALYLLGYSDRTPAQYTMTFPKGYNAPSLKQENVLIKRVVPKNYSLGETEVASPSGNPLRVYDLERTLCDILRGSGSDIQIITDAMKRYAASKEKDIHKLMQYAEQLRVKPKVLRYMEVLL
ncbi:MAG: AbiEi antitoxin N-terminal domain-containing protein [Lachnospiraceae bacterium]|nr:AbiEi antitoxin N-terminal domain-containing protein [Lachnospiraceae bacterium]